MLKVVERADCTINHGNGLYQSGVWNQGVLRGFEATAAAHLPAVRVTEDTDVQFSSEGVLLYECCFYFKWNV